MEVLFVCLGNICRSPTAEGVLRHKLREAGLVDQVDVASAGTGEWHVGNPPDFFFPLAWFYRLFGKRFIFDQHDLSPETYLSKFEGVRKGLLYRILLKSEALSYRASDAVVATKVFVDETCHLVNDRPPWPRAAVQKMLKRLQILGRNFACLGDLPAVFSLHIHQQPTDVLTRPVPHLRAWEQRIEAILVTPEIARQTLNLGFFHDLAFQVTTVHIPWQVYRQNRRCRFSQTWTQAS